MDVGAENGNRWEYFFDQGNTSLCTLYAISRSICNASKRQNKRLLFADILNKLRYYITLKTGELKAWFPEDFNEVTLPMIPFRNINGEEEECNDIAISVKRLENFNLFNFDEEFILVDRRNPMDHCMPVICIIVDDVDGNPYFLCRDNRDTGKKEERYAHVSFHKNNNALYEVAINIGLGDFGLDQLSINDVYRTSGPNSSASTSSDEVDWKSNRLETKWKSSYMFSNSRILQCISYAISECCKELKFYISPDVVQSQLLGRFDSLYERNLLESPAAPEEFNKQILQFESKHIKAQGNEDIDPVIEVQVSQQQSYTYHFNTEFVYTERSKHGKCYYIICKSRNGNDEFFVCRDLAHVLGSKAIRFPWQNANDNAFSLYKIKVNNEVYFDEEMEDMEFE